MAALFGQLRPGSVRDRLPTEHELPPDQRAQLEVARVNSLLLRLGALLPASPASPASPAGAPEVPQLNLPADRDIAGAGKVWTQIAAVSGGLGITVKGMSCAMARFSEDAEKPIFGLEKIDAMAWAVTTIPGSVQKKLDGQGVRVLRRSGIPAPGPLERI